MIKRLVVLSMAVSVLTGCGTTRMYEGQQIPRDQVALLYIQERPNMRYTKINGQPVDFIHDGKVLEFRPGVHTFEFEMNTYRAYGTLTSVTYTPNYMISSYRTQLEMRPGYSYSLDFLTVNVDRLPENVCFFGEPHDAPGGEVLITGEYRRMSEKAERFGCTTAHSTRPNSAD